MDLDTKADRAILLLSDGESWDSDLTGELARLNEEGVRVYSVGIGSLAGAPIPNEGGGFKKDRQGEVVMTKLDETTLKRIASDTEGAYVQSTGGASDTREIVGALNRQLAAGLRQRREKIWNERFQWPLGGAIALLFVGSLFRSRRAGVSAWCWVWVSSQGRRPPGHRTPRSMSGILETSGDSHRPPFKRPNTTRPTAVSQRWRTEPGCRASQRGALQRRQCRLCLRKVGGGTDLLGPSA